MKETAKTYASFRQKKNKWVILGQRFIFVSLGAMIMGVALQLFLVPNQILDGGITGISIILSHLAGWKLGILFSS